jgi:hypothetical protein
VKGVEEWKSEREKDWKSLRGKERVPGGDLQGI